MHQLNVKQRDYTRIAWGPKRMRAPGWWCHNRCTLSLSCREKERAVLARQYTFAFAMRAMCNPPTVCSVMDSRRQERWRVISQSSALLLWQYCTTHFEEIEGGRQQWIAIVFRQWRIIELYNLSVEWCANNSWWLSVLQKADKTIQSRQRNSTGNQLHHRTIRVIHDH